MFKKYLLGKVKWFLRCDILGFFWFLRIFEVVIMEKFKNIWNKNDFKDFLFNIVFRVYIFSLLMFFVLRFFLVEIVSIK